jgi:hypothetical protein
MQLPITLFPKTFSSFFVLKFINGNREKAMGGTKKVNTFPSQALPCSGSTGIFSAGGKPQAPRGIVDTKLIIKIFPMAVTLWTVLRFTKKHPLCLRNNP